MRKYLMTGVAAIALCAAFTSCSKNEELYDANAAKGISTEQAIAKVYETSWTLADLGLILDVDEFHAGDRLRFYAEGIPTPTNGDQFTNDEQKAWITVVIGSITPYFINTEFPYYANINGKKVFKNSGCIEVVLDQASADLLNPYISNGKIAFQVQGRNFTLKRIARVVEKNN